jgi:hypothetical protein
MTGVYDINERRREGVDRDVSMSEREGCNKFLRAWIG